MSAGRCTWVNCREGAVHQEIDRDGSPWAALCQFHHDKLEAACRNKEMGTSVIAALERDRADLIKALTSTVEVAATYAPMERVAVAHVMMSDNPRFDKARFLKACGFGE